MPQQCRGVIHCNSKAEAVGVQEHCAGPNTAYAANPFMKQRQQMNRVHCGWLWKEERDRNIQSRSGNSHLWRALDGDRFVWRQCEELPDHMTLQQATSER